jgi:hypothetical protein
MQTISLKEEDGCEKHPPQFMSFNCIRTPDASWGSASVRRTVERRGAKKITKANNENEGKDRDGEGTGEIYGEIYTKEKCVFVKVMEGLS